MTFGLKCRPVPNYSRIDYTLKYEMSCWNIKKSQHKDLEKIIAPKELARHGRARRKDNDFHNCSFLEIGLVTIADYYPI